MVHIGSGRTLVTGDGRRRVRLGKLIKSGGAGSVYHLADDPLQVAKIYHPGQEPAQYEARLAAMLALTPDLPDLVEGDRRYVQIAWPQALLYAEPRRFAGFLMPAVDVAATAELEMVLQERQARAHGLPTGLGAKVTLAANLAAVIAELHRQGHHVVDLKPVNLRFYPRSLYMAMLDCDGFSIRGRERRFLAPQFTPDYLAPEFHAAGLTAAGEETQDRFALAVIVFQLLNFGLHPYSGRPLTDRVATDIPGRIAQRAWAYGRRPSPLLAPSPVSGHLAIAGDLRALFDRAFDGAGAARPAAAEWAAALRLQAQRAHGRLLRCAKDPEHQHFAGLPCAACVRAAMIADAGRRAPQARREAERRVAQTLPPRGGPAFPPPPPPRNVRPSTRPPPPRPVPPGPRMPAGWRPPPPTRRSRNPSILGWALRALGRLLARLGLLGVVALLFLLRMCFDAGTRTYSPPPPWQPPASAPAAPTAPPPPAAPAAAVDAAAADFEKRLRAATDAAVLGADVALLQALLALEPPPAIAVEARAAAATLVLTEAAVRQRPDLRQRILRGMPAQSRDPDEAIRAAVLNLAEGRPADARQRSLQALRMAPGAAGAWYVLALTEADDAGRVGALAIAERNAARDPRGAKTRDRFIALLPLLDRDVRRWSVLVARARRLEAVRSGKPLPDDVRRLAEQPLAR